MLTPEEFKSLHVLVIDDEPFIRKLIGRLLREIGVRTTFEAGDGREALQVLDDRNGDVDLILRDLEMSGMDGLQFIHALRAHKDAKLAKLPVIVLTGHAEDEVVRGAISLNIQGYVVKPVSKKQLVTRIVHAVKG